jgi:hypothetical protein
MPLNNKDGFFLSANFLYHGRRKEVICISILTECSGTYQTGSFACLGQLKDIPLMFGQVGHHIRRGLELRFKIEECIGQVHFNVNNNIYSHYMFTKLYLSSTDPELSLSELIVKHSGHILMSVVFHTVIYLVSVNVVVFIFTGNVLSDKINQRLWMFLITVMLFGYLARFYHVKEIYHAYDNDVELTRKHADLLYIGWIFIA